MHHPGFLVAVLGICLCQEHEGLDWLIESVPGVPGEDYPIYAEVPDTGFTCDGQVEGGKYADPGAECQVISFWKSRRTLTDFN